MKSSTVTPNDLIVQYPEATEMECVIYCERHVDCGVYTYKYSKKNCQLHMRSSRFKVNTDPDTVAFIRGMYSSHS